MSALILFISLSLAAHANDLSNVVHQLSADNPCWETTKAELNALVSNSSNPKCLRDAQKAFRASTSLRETSQNLIFDLVGERVRKQNQCLKSVFEALSSQKNQKLNDYWIQAASSRLAEYIYRQGRISRLKGMERQKQWNLRVMTANPKVSREELRNALTDKSTNYEEEAKKDQAISQRVFSEIPLIQHETVRKNVMLMLENQFGATPENFPKDIGLIRARITQALRTSSPSAFQTVVRNFDEDFQVNSEDESTREIWLKEGNVAQMLAESLPQNHALQKKFYNCAAGDYGAMASAIKILPDVAMALVGGWAGAAGKGAALTGGLGLRSALGAAYHLGLGAATGSGLSTALSTLPKACLDKRAKALAKAPADCADPRRVMDNAVEWMDYESCLAEVSLSLL